MATKTQRKKPSKRITHRKKTRKQRGGTALCNQAFVMESGVTIPKNKNITGDEGLYIPPRKARIM